MQQRIKEILGDLESEKDVELRAKYNAFRKKVGEAYHCCPLDPVEEKPEASKKKTKASSSSSSE